MIVTFWIFILFYYHQNYNFVTDNEMYNNHLYTLCKARSLQLMTVPVSYVSTLFYVLHVCYIQCCSYLAYQYVAKYRTSYAEYVQNSKFPQ